MRKIGLLAIGRKGLSALSGLIESRSGIEVVAVGRDANIQNDYAGEITTLAQQYQIPTVDRNDFHPEENVTYFAAGWRWMIRGIDEEDLIVFHDSLLPKYRGFAPLVNALINGEEEIGATALKASEQYDEGAIIAQKSIGIRYPIKIAQAVDKISDLYRNLAIELGRAVSSGKPLAGSVQNEKNATYSLWRTKEDYEIDWQSHCTRIARFVDAVGYPYKGAVAKTVERQFIVDEIEARPEYRFEIHHPGKVFRIEEGRPLVAVGNGAVRITSMRDADTGESVLPWSKIRIRFI